MYEDITMEKKLIRSLQSPKGIGETKKNQDASVSKSFLKSRKREKPNPKIEQSKIPSNTIQKVKLYGKKTSTRSSNHELGGKVTELGAVDDDFDLKRSKKQNLAHLLNIHCKPRESTFNSTYRFATREACPNSIRSLMSTQKHKYNKEQFLQANCQFVVRADGEYDTYMADPDILVDWSQIEQIRLSSDETITCPICLCAPTAGKITRCGHVYCWSCILHYLALTDKSWHKCPICFDAIHEKDLKSIQVVSHQSYRVGQEIILQLMKRERGSTVCIPVTESSRAPNTLLSVSEVLHSTLYSKLLLARQSDVMNIITFEEAQLQIELKENEGCPELCFVEQAMTLLKKRKDDLFERMNLPNTDNCDLQNFIEFTCVRSPEIAKASCSKTIENEADSENLQDATSDNNVIDPNSSSHRNRYASVSSSGDEVCTNVTAEDLEINVSSNAPFFKTFYFYQAMDGQQIYLHSINARMLEKQYGSLERSPHILTGNIIEIESGSMTVELRKRLRYLDHLPVTCQFQVVEIDFPEPIISAEIKSFFKDQLDKRIRLRLKKIKEERRIEKQAEIFVRKQYGCHSPPRRLRLDSLHHFPQCGAEEVPSISPRTRSPVSSRTSSPASSKRSASPTTAAMNALSLNSDTFAQKLKNNNKDGGWQKRRTVVEDESSTSHSSRNLISDAVEAALIKARLEKQGNDQNNGRNRKKKKKQKAIPLCSLNVAYEH